MPTQPAQQLLYLRIFGRSKHEGGGGGGGKKRSSRRFPLAFANLTSDIGRQHELGHQS